MSVCLCASELDVAALRTAPDTKTPTSHLAIVSAAATAYNLHFAVSGLKSAIPRP